MRDNIPDVVPSEEKYELSISKRARNHIPSTVELEDRFSALERQLSSNGLPSKSSMDLRRNENQTGEKDTQTPPNTPNESNKLNLERGESKTQLRNEIEGEAASEVDARNAEKPRLKKLPSTAELEDRFNALERRMSTQKSSPIKTKKEPPDEAETKEPNKKREAPAEEKSKKDCDIKGKAQERHSKEDDKANKGKSVAKEKISPDQKKGGEKVNKAKVEEAKTSNTKQEVEVEDSAKRIPKTTEYTAGEKTNKQEGYEDKRERDVGKQTAKSTTNNEKELKKINHSSDSLESESKQEVDIERSKLPQENNKAALKKTGDDLKKSEKKSPPSTEELEKRFQALERQMSSASLEGNKETRSSSESEKTNQTRSSKGKQNSSQSVNAQVEAASNKSKQTAPLEPATNTKAIKSFEEKCKQINKELSKQTKPELEQSEQTVAITTPEPKLVEALNEKCKEINKELSKPKETTNVEQREAENEDTSNVANKRRASEPPTTEDLEKRFESLKRRMSTKAIIEKGFGVKDKSATVLEEGPHEILDVEETKSQATIKSAEPPSTEDLESRYEALQRRASEQKAENLEKRLENQQRAQKEEIVDTKTAKRTSKTEVKESAEEKKLSENTARIPVAPPMPLNDTAELLVNDEQHRALIEEFQSKIKVQPNGENLKPSDINPNRRTTTERQRTSPFDGTSETHANTAYFRSENYEPWYSQPQKMVRRFSDLPSKADLENRLHFLERQLIIKFYKQRCASDSEVASRKYFMDLKSRSADDETPSTSARAQQQAADDLEKRVLALEKQLSENSLKLLEAVRVKEQEAAAESDSPRRLSSETVDATGKELVRYVGELEETGSLKPINISINIKMLLKKNEDEENKPKEKLPTAAELEKRLEVLEQQLKMSRSRREGSIDQYNVNDGQELKKSEEKSDEYVAEEIESKEVIKEPPEMEKRETKEALKETLEIEKNVKEAFNEECKSDKKTTENVNTKNEENEKSDIRIEVLKAEKTLENQQIARSKKEIVEDKRECKAEEKSDTPQNINADVHDKNENKSRQEVAVEKRANEEDIPTEETLPTQPEQLTDTTAEVEPKETLVVKDEPKQEKHDDGKESTKTPENHQVAKDEPKQEKHDNSKESTKTPGDQTSAEPSVEPMQTAIQVGSSDPNNKTLVLLLDNEPKAVKVRRLTRANTEELENLFQALEKQLSDRNLIKSEDGKLMRAAEKSDVPPSEEAKALTQLSKEIEDYTKANPNEKEKETKKEKQKDADKSKSPAEDYDWGPDPVKRHLKRKTVHLPSTKELEARFRSLERQIKLLEDVEKIDVEQRLNEIERKIKMQYSLSHEKDLTKFLELCEGKNLDELPEAITAARDRYQIEDGRASRTPTPKQGRSPYTSPSRVKEKTPYTSPTHPPRESRSPKRHTSPGRISYDGANGASKSPKRHVSPGYVRYEDPDIPSTENLEYRFRALELPRSKSKESLNEKSKRNIADAKKSLIHPLEMLLDPSPDEDVIPTTGELEHRIRVLDDKRRTPSPARQLRSRSPTIEDIKNRKLAEEKHSRTTPIHNLETLVASPTKRELPTADELEARMRALEEEHCFDFKMQKTYQEFNQKLKDAVSPSLSFEEFKTSKSREESPRRSETTRSTTPKSALRDSASNYEDGQYRSISPKAIRFRDEEDDYVTSLPHRPKSHTDTRDNIGRMVGKINYGALGTIEENSKFLQRILKKTLADSCSSISASGVTQAHASEGLDEFGSRLMRETSPLQRTGSHTGVPLRTNDNINERLDSIKNTIKSIDTLCEEKPYRKERCQRYIDSLFSDSIHFGSKKASLEDLSRSESRVHREYAPSIRVSDHSQRHSDYLYGRSLGSADSIRSTSPLRAASPLHHRSNRDLRREISPRRRREEEREEYQSRLLKKNI